jgi:uncharacterized protein YdhG (YjbR/CyaY superfamily)
MSPTPNPIDKYLAARSEEQRAALERLRKTMKAIAPKAEECLSYSLAAFRLDGKPLVAFGATRKQCALYLMSGSIVQAHQNELQGYDTSKGTIRFQPDKPLPIGLVRKLIRARIEENNRARKRPSQVNLVGRFIARRPAHPRNEAAL